MKLKNYCLVALVSLEANKAIKDDLLELANSQPIYFEAPGVFMTTFASTFEPTEIKDFINTDKIKTFFVFEVDEKVSAVSMTHEKFYNHLFKHIEDSKEISGPLMGVMIGGPSRPLNNSGDTATTATMEVETEIDVEKINPNERIELFNDLIERLDTLTIKEKNLLNKLSENL